MICQNCGAEIPEGAMFCVVCGTPAQQPQANVPNVNPAQMQQSVPGGVPGGMPAQPMQSQIQPQAGFPGAQPGQPQMQPGGYPNGQQAYPGQAPGGYPMGYAGPSPAGLVMSDMFHLMGESITQPLNAARSVYERNRGVQGLLLAIIEVLLLFFSFLIHLPIEDASSFVSASTKAKIGMYAVLTVIFIYMLSVLATYIFRNKMDMRFSFVNIMGMYGTATVYGSIAVVSILLFGIFASVLALVVGIVSFIIWVSLSSIIMKEVVDGDDNKKTMITIFSKAIITVIVLILIYAIVRTSASNYVSNIFNDLF